MNRLQALKECIENVDGLWNVYVLWEELRAVEDEVRTMPNALASVRYMLEDVQERFEHRLKAECTNARENGIWPYIQQRLIMQVRKVRAQFHLMSDPISKFLSQSDVACAIVRDMPLPPGYDH
jgi:hypothetical protein